MPQVEAAAKYQVAVNGPIPETFGNFRRPDLPTFLGPRRGLPGRTETRLAYRDRFFISLISLISRRSSIIATRRDIFTNVKLSANIEAIKTQIMVSPYWDSYFTDEAGNDSIFHAKHAPQQRTVDRRRCSATRRVA
ncbi:hypothetical protein CKO51_21525 [Rhodopirellula sp. SM50]|nr:hypothetical protein CKO51_21525 [Rhodopirellula sp. SM50]